MISFNSADATKVDAVYGNGKFTCQMTNSNRAGTHAIKVVPAKIMIPNVFPNITQGMNYIYTTRPVEDPGSLEEDVRFPVGFYTLEGIVSRLNDRLSLNVSFNQILTRIQIENVSGAEVDLVMSRPFATMLGLTDNQFSPNFAPSQVSVLNEVTLKIASGATVVASSVPFIGTTPLVHVLARKAATQNLLSSNSTEYSVLATVLMNRANFGEYATYEAPDVFVDDIDFRTPRNLSDIDFEIVDHLFNPITIDPRFPVIIQLKVFHVDTQK